MTAADDSLAARTASIIASLSTGKWSTPTLARAIEGAINYPDQVADFVQAIVTELPRNNPSHDLLPRVLPFLPESDFPRVAADMMAAITRSPDNFIAYLVVELTAWQCPAALYPYLPTLFNLRNNEGAYYGQAPWHGVSAAVALPFLRSVIESDARSDSDRTFAWSILFASGDLDLACYASLIADRIPTIFTHLRAIKLARAHGYDVVENDSCDDGTPYIRRLYSEPDAIYYLVFTEGYVMHYASPVLRPLLNAHPTLHVEPIPGVPMRFGGLVQDTPGCGVPFNTVSSCASCGGPLHHLLTLTPVPNGLGVTGIESLRLATCLSCIFRVPEALYFAHDADGVPSPTAYDGPMTKPQEPVEMLVPTAAHLAHVPARWRWLNWYVSYNNENRCRLGGKFSWIQDAYYAACPTAVRR